METMVSLLLNSLTLVSVLMLIAIGLAVIYGLIGVINLAHGEFVTIGAYTVAAVQLAGGNFWLGLAVAPLMGGLVGLLIEWAVLRRLYERPVSAILATWGLSLIIQQLLQLIFGAAPCLLRRLFRAASSSQALATPPTASC